MIKRKRLPNELQKNDMAVIQKSSKVSAQDAMDRLIGKQTKEVPNQEKLSQDGKKEYQNG